MFGNFHLEEKNGSLSSPSNPSSPNSPTPSPSRGGEGSG